MLRPQDVKQLLKGLKKLPDQKLDDLFHTAHEDVFEKTDCLQCANCCKTTSPLFLEKDIERLAKFLKMKPGSFSAQYLRKDEDGDYVLHSSPCPFLLGDQSCSVYEARPKACREYPHTNRKKIRQIFSLTEKNAAICPAVERIIAQVSQQVQGGA